MITDIPVGKYVLFCSDFVAAGIEHPRGEGSFFHSIYGDQVIGPGRVVTIQGCMGCPCDEESIRTAIQHKRKMSSFKSLVG